MRRRGKQETRRKGESSQTNSVRSFKTQNGAHTHTHNTVQDLAINRLKSNNYDNHMKLIENAININSGLTQLKTHIA